MSTTQSIRGRSSASVSPSRRAGRLTAVVATVVATGTVWGLIEGPAGNDIRFEDGFDINLLAVVASSLVACLAGWGFLALVERRSSRPRRTWVLAAGLALLISLGGPFSRAGMEIGDRLLLVLLHVTTAAVLIPLMARTTPPAR